MDEVVLAPLVELIDPRRKITYGIVQPGPRQPEGEGVPLIRGQDYSSGTVRTRDLYWVLPEVSAPYKRSLVRPGDLLISIVGYVGAIAEVPPQLDGANLTQTTARLAAGSNVDSRFLLHALRGPEFQAEVRRYMKGSAQPGLNLADVERMQVRLLPLAEQRRIAEILDTIDETIQATERVIAKLAMLRDGLRADLIDRAQDAWQPATLNDLGGMLTSGSRGWAYYYAESGEVFLRIGNLTREHPNLRRLDETMFVRPPQGSEEQRTRCEPGDLLISITADLGIIGVIPSSIPRSYVNQHIARVRVNPDLANARFVAHSLQSATGQLQFRRLNDSGAKAGLNLPAVGSLSLRVPTLAVQGAVADQIDEVQGLIDAERLTLSKLRQTRSGLATDLLSGRVRTVAA